MSTSTAPTEGSDLVARAALRHTNVYTIRTELGLTQRELAKHAGVTVQSVMRSEQGLHPHLSGRIANALSELSNSPAGVIRQRYRSCRASNINEFSRDITSIEGYQELVEDALIWAALKDDPPTRIFRESIFKRLGLPTSGIKFCVYTGLHSAVLSNIENGKVTWRECKVFHRVLAEVLQVPPIFISQLGDLHDEFYLMSHHD